MHTPEVTALLERLHELSGNERASMRKPDLDSIPTKKSVSKRLQEFEAALRKASQHIQRRELNPLTIRHFVSEFLDDPYTMGELLMGVVYNMQDPNFNLGRLRGRQLLRLHNAYELYQDLKRLYPLRAAAGPRRRAGL